MSYFVSFLFLYILTMLVDFSPVIRTSLLMTHNRLSSQRYLSLRLLKASWDWGLVEAIVI